ncbi:MAG: aspartate/glutamate racemase family protein [Pseudomonadota bacterium]
MTDSSGQTVSEPSAGKPVHVRLGVIVPTTNTVNEAEWRTIAARLGGMSLHVSRILLTEALHDAANGLPDDLRAAMRPLEQAEVDLIAYGCTAGSLVLPLDALTGAMQRASARPCVATAPALIAACRTLGVSRVSIGTPYAELLNSHERSFFEDAGLRVDRIVGLGIGAGGMHEYTRIAKLTPDEVEALAVSALAEGSEALVLSCTDLPTLALIPRFEARFGIPVMSSNLATLWNALRTAGIDTPVTGFGSLLELR